jgi:cyclopropane-fatty-acyl-phospholipid synthase
MPDVARSAATAATLLERLFAPLPAPLAFRLWDGTTVRVGAPGSAPCTVVFRSPAVFRRLLRRPTPLAFGEAFICEEIDIEGDMFGAMAIANDLEKLRVPLRTRLATLARLRHV